MVNIDSFNFLNMPKFILLLILMSASIGFAVEQTKGPIEKTGQKIDKASEKVVEYIDDSTITAKIKSEILKDPLTKMYKINVTTKNGNVELTGIVDSQDVINRALEIANKNVSSVKNNLFIKNVK